MASAQGRKNTLRTRIQELRSKINAETKLSDEARTRLHARLDENFEESAIDGAPMVSIKTWCANLKEFEDEITKEVALEAEIASVDDPARGDDPVASDQPAVSQDGPPDADGNAPPELTEEERRSMAGHCSRWHFRLRTKVPNVLEGGEFNFGYTPNADFFAKLDVAKLRVAYDYLLALCRQYAPPVSKRIYLDVVTLAGNLLAPDGAEVLSALTEKQQSFARQVFQMAGREQENLVRDQDLSFVTDFVNQTRKEFEVRRAGKPAEDKPGKSPQGKESEMPDPTSGGNQPGKDGNGRVPEFLAGLQEAVETLNRKIGDVPTNVAIAQLVTSEVAKIKPVELPDSLKNAGDRLAGVEKDLKRLISVVEELKGQCTAQTQLPAPVAPPTQAPLQSKWRAVWGGLCQRIGWKTGAITAGTTTPRQGSSTWQLIVGAAALLMLGVMLGVMLLPRTSGKDLVPNVWAENPQTQQQETK